MGVQHLSASMASLSCVTIHDVTTRIRNIVRHILGERMCSPQCPNCHTVELDAWIGNMSRLPLMAFVESKVSLDLLGMTPLTSLPMTLCICAQDLSLYTG